MSPKLLPGQKQFTVPSDSLQGHVITRTYTWGPDLSGEVGGAGGVGGLQKVVITDIDQNTPEPTINTQTWIPAYDGNGNVVAYLDQATGNIVQEEEYGPFGEPLRSRSTSVIRSPIGWSSKYTDEETGLVYYGYRYYAPQVGRWINKDPMGEGGGIHLQAFCVNRPNLAIDPLGLAGVIYEYPEELKLESGTPHLAEKNQFAQRGFAAHIEINMKMAYRECNVQSLMHLGREAILSWEEISSTQMFIAPQNANMKPKVWHQFVDSELWKKALNRSISGSGRSVPLRMGMLQ